MFQISGDKESKSKKKGDLDKVSRQYFKNFPSDVEAPFHSPHNICLDANVFSPPPVCLQLPNRTVMTAKRRQNQPNQRRSPQLAQRPCSKHLETRTKTKRRRRRKVGSPPTLFSWWAAEKHPTVSAVCLSGKADNSDDSDSEKEEKSKKKKGKGKKKKVEELI